MRVEHFKNSEGMAIVIEMIKAIQQNKAYLGEVDGLIGDGDHGTNMNKGFSICASRLEGQKNSFTDALNELGNVLLTEIGGSMGPIYGTIFIEMAEKAKDVEEIDSLLFADMLDSAIIGLEDIIEAKVGDKTIMDSLCPARDAFLQAVKSGESFLSALEKLKQAAEEGKESTKNFVAKFGRSSRLGERSRGVLDAGAVSCSIILLSMADGIASRLNV